MLKLCIPSGVNTPEIYFSPEENIFVIKGKSAPEDVRALYYPVISWVKEYTNSLLADAQSVYTPENPLKFKVDLLYFNSSSAKFLNDIFTELRRLSPKGICVRIEWFYDEEDIDMKDAGTDISILADMEFTYVPKLRQ
jgi:hypothetical protein